MRIFGTMAAALGLVGAIAIGTTAPAAADWYGNHHRYYNYYGGGGGSHAKAYFRPHATPSARQ